MKNQLVDNMANIVVLGALLKEPALFEQTEKYHFSAEDFTERLSKVCFISINNLYANGLKKIEVTDIYNYLVNSHPEEAKNFESKRGVEFLQRCAETSDGKKLEYYYGRMKKFSLLRMYDSHGVDVSDFYDVDNIEDLNKKANQESWLDESTVEDIMDAVSLKLEKIANEFKFEGYEKAEKIGLDVQELLTRVEESPNIGLPSFFGILNTVTAGTRLKKFYTISASSGYGKSRTMAGQACMLAVGEYYDEEIEEWVKAQTTRESTLFISTELEKDEVMLMCLAFISGVNEKKISRREVPTFEELARIQHAAELLQDAPLYFEYLPDFTVEDVDRAIKLNIDQNDVSYAFFDYIHSSMSLIGEISRAAGGVKIREDQVLFILSSKLKEIANKYGVFVESGTQLNRSGNDQDKEINASVIRGASSIIDRTDFSAVITPPKEEDMEKYRQFAGRVPSKRQPNAIWHIIKSRGTEYAHGMVWCYMDLGTCRVYPICYTKSDYTLVQVPELKITVER